MYCQNQSKNPHTHTSKDGTAEQFYLCSEKSIGVCATEPVSITSGGKPLTVCSESCPFYVKGIDPGAPVTLSFTPIELPPRNKTRAVVTLAVGAKFKELLDVSRPTFQAYAAKCGADYVEIVLDTAACGYPMAEKFGMMQLFDAGYHEVLYLDADTIVMPAPSLFDAVPFGYDVAILDDMPRLKNAEWVGIENKRITDSQGWEPIPRTCFNTGVMLIRDRRVVDLPTLPIPKTQFATNGTPQGHFIEQCTINCNIHRHGLKVFPLGQEWNRQWWVKQSLPVTPGTWIYHWSSVPHKRRLDEMTARRDGVELPSALVQIKEPVGTKLSEVLTECGIAKTTCGECNYWLRSMNEWGIDGCRERRESIISRLNMESKKATWIQWARVAAKGYTSSAALLDEAIRRASVV